MYTLLYTFGYYSDQITIFCGVFDTREEVNKYIKLPPTSVSITSLMSKPGEYSLFYSNINETVSMQPWSNNDILHVEKIQRSKEETKQWNEQIETALYNRIKEELGLNVPKNVTK